MIRLRQFFVFLFLIVFLTLSISSCENNTKDSQMGVKEVLNQASIVDIDSTLDCVSYCNEAMFKGYCKKMYDLDYNEVSDGAIVYSSDSACASEVSILKADGKSLNDVLKNRVNNRLKTFQGYSPTEVKKIENSCVFEYKGFYILIISDSVDAIKEKIQDTIS